MKQFLFLFLLLSPLWAYSSCEEEDKLPGSKPAILFGEWENYRYAGWSFMTEYIHEIYEFTPKGGSIKEWKYIPEEDRYEDYYTRYFTDWSYSESEKTIYFLRKKGSYTDRWSQSLYEMTQDSIKFGLVNSNIVYSKVQ